jgi:hypothetical protein
MVELELSKNTKADKINLYSRWSQIKIQTNCWYKTDKTWSLKQNSVVACRQSIQVHKLIKLYILRQAYKCSWKLDFDIRRRLQEHDIMHSVFTYKTTRTIVSSATRRGYGFTVQSLNFPRVL